MDITNDYYNVAGRPVDFTQWTTSTRYAVTEHAEMIVNGYPVSSGTEKWTNRPWHRFKYQNARIEAANKLYKKREEQHRCAWMEGHGYERMTAKRKAEFAEWFDSQEWPACSSDSIGFYLACRVCAAMERDTYGVYRNSEDVLTPHDLEVLEHLQSVRRAGEDPHGYKLYRFEGSTGYFVACSTLQTITERG